MSRLQKTTGFASSARRGTIVQRELFTAVLGRALLGAKEVINVIKTEQNSLLIFLEMEVKSAHCVAPLCGGIFLLT